jgi:hypothetical protein
MTVYVYDSTGRLMEERDELPPMKYTNAEGRTFSVESWDSEPSDVFIIKTSEGAVWARLNYPDSGPELRKVAVAADGSTETLGSLESDFAFRSDFDAPEGDWTAHVEATIARMDGGE